MPHTHATHVPFAGLTPDDWTDLLTAILPEWRRHRRCGANALCWQAETDRFDYLLDQWLAANPRTTTTPSNA